MLPDARFRGVSRALLKALEHRALERGNLKCHLISTETARRFYLAAGYVDRHFATAAGKERASNSRSKTPSPLPSTSSGACVDADGSWKNWHWANVPMLSPKCRPDQ